MISSAPKKRFWTETSLIEAEDGFGIQLDGRDIKTPNKNPLIVPTRALGELMFAEWDKQEGSIDPLSLPATRGANSTIDTVCLHFDAVVDQLAEYAGSDLLCYRADGPTELVTRQAEVWDPVLDWASKEMNAPLAVTTGVLPIDQDQASLEAVRDKLCKLSPFELTGMHDLVTLSGSAIIAMAVSTNHLSVWDGWNASRLDENWQIELWGEDEDASKAAHVKWLDFEFAKKFMDSAKVD